jgi:hypothetical protein
MTTSDFYGELMKKFWFFFNWSIASFLLFVGITAIANGDFSVSIMFFLIALIFFPPALNKIESKTGKPVSLLQKIGFFFVVSVISGSIFRHMDNEEYAAEFNSNRTQILTKARSDFSNKKYENLITSTENYEFLHDKELEELRSEASNILTAEKIKTLLTQARKTPEGKSTENLQIYNQLVDLDPKNETFQQRQKYFQLMTDRQKIDNQESKTETQKANESDDDFYVNKLKPGYPACLSEELFEEFTQAIINNDDTQKYYLLSNGCIRTNPKIHYSFIEHISLGTVKIRVYLSEGKSVIAWTNVEAVMK